MSGSGTAYRVLVNTGTGSGSLRLDMVDNDTIVDALSTPLGGAGAVNGDYTSGESYTINKDAPTQDGGLIVNEVSNGTSGAREWVELLVIGPAATVDLSGWIIDENNGDFDSFTSGKGIATGHIRFANSIPACATGQSLAAAPLGARIVIYNAGDAEGALASYPNDPCDSNGDGVYYLPVGDNPNNTAVLEQCTETPRYSSNPMSLDYSGCTYTSPATSWAPMSLANTGDAFQARTQNAIFYHGFAYGDLSVPPAPNFPDGNPSFNISTLTGTNMAYQFQCGNYFSNSAGQFLRLNAGLANPGAVNNLGNAVFLRSMQLGTFNYADLSNIENCRIEPQVSMSFLQSQVTAGQQAQLSITLKNPYEAIDGFILDLLGIQFTNTLPVGKTLSGTNPVSNTCGGMFAGTSGASSFSLSGVALPTVSQPSSNTCTIVVNVTPQISGEFTSELSAGSVTSAALGAGGGSNIDPASATLLVDAAPPVADLPVTLPSTGFTPSKITALPDQPVAKIYTQFDGLMLEIPKIKVLTSIVGIPITDENWDLTWLDGQAGWLNSTAFPTWSGNSVITGHVWNAMNNPGPFANLAELNYGDKIIVHAWGQDYIYEVRSMEKYVSPTDTSVFRHEDLPWITLITCQGFDEKSNSYRWHMVVRAVLIEVK